jgi:PadR family transcriptional regulator, regulatory protein AphA
MPAKSKTRYALLGILNLYPMSGYDLKKFCDQVVSQFWNENYAHIYPVLRELEKEGLATTQTAQTEGRPVKRIYSITEKGKEELKAWLLEPAEALPRRYEFILKLFFSADVPAEHLTGVIRQYREINRQDLEMYRWNEKEAVEGITDENEKSRKLILMTISCGRYESEAMIKWCDETLEILKGMK